MGLALLLTQCAVSSEPTLVPQESAVTPSPELPIADPTFKIQNWPSDETPVARVHVVTIPASLSLEIAITDDLKTVETFAVETEAMAVINGGFFDPNNAQTTSFITVNGALVANPQDNRRLIDNPVLTPYLDQILNRSEFRRYTCGEAVRYDITRHSEPVPSGCTLHSALGAGPQLLPEDTSQQEGFTDYADDNLIRDAIGSQQRNARSAIGIAQDGTVVWVMVAQAQPLGGMTLTELATFMTTLGIQQALNLDGGSSASLYFALTKESQTYFGRLDNNGQPIRRPVKSVLLIK
ncbi:MAG: phosphodiester glycosidase family protein [Cyanobacteria bacterium P01_H01_bin.21]